MIVVARKPLVGTVAANVLRHGTGALNIDASRIASSDPPMGWDSPRGGIWTTDSDATGNLVPNAAGRWPANVIHDGSPEVEAAFAAFGEGHARGNVTPAKRRAANGIWAENGFAFGAGRDEPINGGDAGSASRFFYSAKADASDRADSRHPTVKPVDLMRYLVRLVTPPGGTVLDPFAGSGTTAEACMLEGFDALLIEQDAQHIADIEHRVRRWSGLDMPLFAQVAAE